jgi:phosphatidate cytidylyltransferase
VTVEAALASELFRLYLVIVVLILLLAGMVLGLLTLAGKNVGAVWKTYRGWLVMIPLVMGTLFLGREATIIGVTLLALAGFKEFARATSLYDDWWLTGLVYMAIAALGLLAWMPDPRLGTPGWYGMFMVLPAYVVGLVLLVPIARNRARGQLQQTALAIFGFVYLGWMFSHLSLLANLPQAYGYLLFLVFAVEINDVAAFSFGRLFGRHKLREKISPNKTLEGSLGAVAVSMTLPWLLWFSFPHFGVPELILTGLIVGIGGQLGDLVISTIKRDIGIKDMGAVISGHGGVLDRIDSMIFVAPLFYHMVRWFHGTA